VGVSGNRRRSFSRGGVIAASALAHLVVLAIIALSLPKVVVRATPAPSAVNVWLMPRLTSDLRSHATQRTTAAPAGLAAAPPRASRPAPSPGATVVAPTPAGGSPGGGPSAAGPTGPSAGGDLGQGVQGALRSRIGCDALTTHLTAEEKDRCSQRFGQEALKGPRFIDPIPEEKRAYYDAVQAAYQASRDPQHPFFKDANGNIQSWGHPPAVGCTFKRHFKPGASMSDKIKATGMIGVPIGPLSCGLALPQGSMTPELGIPTP